MSRFDATLATAVAEERNEGRRLQLMMKIASSRARKGDIVGARQLISEIRGNVVGSESAQLFAHINFAEGICDYFETGAKSSLVKLKRARALSSACPPDDDLPCLVSAWLASANRILGQWDQLHESLVQVFLPERTLSDEASARISLVVADALHETENQIEADRWYQISRRFAVRQGDESAIGAILYNRSVLRVFNLRLAEASGRNVDIDECRIALEAASAENYSLYVHDTSMQWAFEILFGQVHMLRRNYSAALKQLSSDGLSRLEGSWPAVDIVRIADTLRCKAGLGQIESAELVARSVALASRASDDIGHGDLAIAFYSLGTACQALGHSYASDCHRESANHLMNFRKVQELEAETIRRFFELASKSSAYVELTSLG